MVTKHLDWIHSNMFVDYLKCYFIVRNEAFQCIANNYTEETICLHTNKHFFFYFMPEVNQDKRFPSFRSVKMTNISICCISEQWKNVLALYKL